MSTPTRSSAGALYYPHIHIQNPDWLRANLILFPVVKRMVPFDWEPNDGDPIRPFAMPWGNREALLQPANLQSSRAIQAQNDLAAKLRRDAEDAEFLRRFGRDSNTDLRADPYGFQIHTGKLAKALRRVLKVDGAYAREPKLKEPSSEAQFYIQVHPRIGAAVMSTLAIACAQVEGLDIVGDERSGELRDCLLMRDLESVYDAWLGYRTVADPPRQPSGEELFEFILMVSGDLSALTVEQLHAFSAERAAIADVLTELRKEAAHIPAMDAGPQRDEAFRDAASKVLDQWQADSRNMRGFVRVLFGGGNLSKLTTNFAAKVAEKMFSGATAGAVTAAGGTTAGMTAGSASGSVLAGTIIGAGAGLAVGLVAHAAGSAWAVSRRTRPYRFLTMLEKEGVVFRSDAQPPPFRADAG